MNRCNKLFYSDSGRGTTSRTKRSRRRVYLGQLPARENIQNNSSTTQNIHHSSSTAHIVSSNSSSKIASISKINDTTPSSRIRTVTSLPAYEDCVKTSLSDLEDNNNDCDESILDSTTTTMRTHKEAKKLDFLRNSGMDSEKM